MKNITILLLLLAAVQFTNILDFVIMLPLGPQLMPALGIGSREFGLVISAYTLSAGATGLAAALWLDRFNRRPALLTLYLGFGLGSFACSLAPYLPVVNCRPGIHQGLRRSPGLPGAGTLWAMRCPPPAAGRP